MQSFENSKLATDGIAHGSDTDISTRHGAYQSVVHNATMLFSPTLITGSTRTMYINGALYVGTTSGKVNDL